MKATDELPLDGNLAIADFEKIQHSQTSHICFLALEKFRVDHQRLPKVWDLKDATAFVEFAKPIAKECKVEDEQLQDDGEMARLFYLFSF